MKYIEFMYYSPVHIIVLTYMRARMHTHIYIYIHLHEQVTYITAITYKTNVHPCIHAYNSRHTYMHAYMRAHRST